MRWLFLIPCLCLWVLTPPSAAPAVEPYKKAKVVVKSPMVTALERRGLNPQPLPPREAIYAVNPRINRVLLNPQPLPPRSSTILVPMLRR